MTPTPDSFASFDSRLRCAPARLRMSGGSLVTSSALRNDERGADLGAPCYSVWRFYQLPPDERAGFILEKQSLQ